MGYEAFFSFTQEGHVGIVRLARPERLNTISAPFYEAMMDLQNREIVGNFRRYRPQLRQDRHRDARPQPVRRIPLAAGLSLLA